MTEQRLTNKKRHIILIVLIIIAAVSYLYLSNIKTGEPDLVVLDFGDLEIEIRQGPGRCYPEDCQFRSIEVSGNGEIVSSVQYQNSEIKNQITGRLTDGDFQELATALDQHGFFSFEEGEFCTVPVPDVGDMYMRIKLNDLEHETVACTKLWPDSNGSELVNKILGIRGNLNSHRPARV